MADERRDDGPTVVHMGVGAFHRAHQAWYTHRARTDEDPWGIVAFTGRSPAQARLLQASGCRYTLITRDTGGDTFSEIRSIRAAHDGADRTAWEGALAHPRTHVVTMTITESGYRTDRHGRLDLTDAHVAADLRAVRTGAAAPITTAPVRLAVGLDARRRAGGGPLTVISCDNLSGNGDVARSVVLAAATEIDPALPGWIDENVAFRSSMVDRITPRTRPQDIDDVERMTGIRDEAAVVAEPFSEWVIEEGFAAPAPDWPSAGVRLAADLAPFEQRKLRILNGAHSLLAYRGLLAGHRDVAAAFADPAIRDTVEAYWRVAGPSCRLAGDEVADSIAATRARFANPRIRHELTQIAADGERKLRERILPVLAHAIDAGDDTGAPATAVAAWLMTQERHPDALDDLLSGVTDAGMSDAMSAAIRLGIRRLGDMPVGAAARPAQ
ncbi:MULTISPECIES: mannitol dehydrogenase family protein [unclassified Microbacterium]|uniref:mannitol dehydrogenase family protein n=1 Tax=unclassified Microbacterium TaxID=2609290 RepID=UPI0018E05839